MLPVVSKVIEHHMHNSLYAFLMDNNLLYSRQSGIRRMYSTKTALIKLVDELLFSLDNNHVCGKTKVLTITGKRCMANINGNDIDVIVNRKQLSNVD